MIHGHGGNIFAASSALGCRPEEITDMSANINPLGPMPGLLEHLGSRIKNVCRLPEVDAGHAVRQYARWQGLPEERVIAGAGTTEFLYLLPRALGIGLALVAGPTYADYADALEINNAEYEFFMRKSRQGFRPDLERLAKAAKKADAVFFCNPNNPTGELTDPEELAVLACSLPDTLFIIDESYLPFANGNKNKSLAGAGLANTVVLQSLSKIHCIPGLRIGFCAAPGRLAEKIRKHCPPWSVNAQAQAAVTYIAENREKAEAHAGNTRQYLREQHAAMYAQIENAPGLAAYPSDATFILIQNKHFTAGQIAEHLLAHRLLIRDCSNFRGLNKHFFRISVKDPETNRRAARLIADYAKQRAGAGKAENI